jgi:hypothetical protein
MPDAPFHLELLFPDAGARALARLADALPGLRVTPIGLDIPLVELGAEEALAVCLRLGVTCRGTRVTLPPDAG